MTPLTQLTLNNTQSMYNLPLILATMWVIDNDFAVYSTSAVVIGQYANSMEGRAYQNVLIDTILYRSMNPKPEIKFLVEGEMVPKEVSEDSMTYEERMERFFKFYSNREKSIWFLDSLNAYRKFEMDILDSRQHFHRGGFFLIVYTGMEVERLSNVKEIFNSLFNIYVTNVNVMLVVGNYAYLYTYFPFTKNKCHSSKPEFYVSFRGIDNNGNLTINKRLYPSKLKNMHGCELTIATWTYPPYIYVDRDEETGELKSLHGIEGKLISLLADLMNFKIRIKEPVPRERGDVYPNGTATGAAKMILDAEANITIISYMYNKERSEKMQASFSYLTLPYILAIPQSQPMSPFKRLIKPFRYIIWSCFSSSLFFAIIFIYLIRYVGNSKLMNFIYGRGNRIPFSNLLITLFGGSIYRNVPYRNFARFLLTVWVLYTFVLRTAYSGQLYLILQDGSPRNALQSLSEVVDENYTIYAFPAVEKVVKLAEPRANTRLVDLIDTVPKIFKRISKPGTKEKVALCLLEYSIMSYNQMNPRRRVEMLPEPLLTSPIVFYMPRHSYLNLRTTELLLNIMASGIMKRYHSYYLYASPSSSRDKMEPTKLSFNVLLGLFSIYGVFLLLGIVIFFLEVCSVKSEWIKYFIDFLNM